MKANLKATLTDAITEWVESEADHAERPDAYIYEGLAGEMAAAASAVYDASMNAQLWVKENTVVAKANKA